MKKIVVCAIATLAFIAETQSSKATLVDAWDFFGMPATTSSTATPGTLSATVGTGTLDISSFGLGATQGTNPERTAFSGSQLNTFSGSVDTTGSGTALALANSTANGKSALFTFSMLGYQNLVVSFAARGTASGFNSGVWSWSTDGVNYTTLTGVNTATTSTTFAVFTASFATETGLNDASTAYLKYTLSGATSASGNNRIDNIQFNADVVPEPATMAMAAIGGLAGLMVLRRKR